MKLTHGSPRRLSTNAEDEAVPGVQARSGFPHGPLTEREASEDLVTQLGSPATEGGRADSGARQAVRGSRLSRRRRALLGVGIAAALLAGGGLIGATFVKSPQQLAADTAAPPATVTTAT